MDFVNHSIAWTKGEIFEATIVSIFGILIMFSATLFYKFGSTPNAKALFLPLLIVGIVFAVAGIAMNISNQYRGDDFKQSFREDRSAFIEQEKKRVEGFQYMYTATKITATVFFIFSIAVFVFSHSPQMQAIAIALAILGISGLVIDYFSQERANRYYNEIQNELGIEK